MPFTTNVGKRLSPNKYKLSPNWGQLYFLLYFCSILSDNVYNVNDDILYHFNTKERKGELSMKKLKKALLFIISVLLFTIWIPIQAKANAPENVTMPDIYEEALSCGLAHQTDDGRIIADDYSEALLTPQSNLTFIGFDKEGETWYSYWADFSDSKEIHFLDKDKENEYVFDTVMVFRKNINQSTTDEVQVYDGYYSTLRYDVSLGKAKFKKDSDTSYRVNELMLKENLSKMTAKELNNLIKSDENCVLNLRCLGKDDKEIKKNMSNTDTIPEIHTRMAELEKNIDNLKKDEVNRLELGTVYNLPVDTLKRIVESKCDVTLVENIKNKIIEFKINGDKVYDLSKDENYVGPNRQAELFESKVIRDNNE